MRVSLVFRCETGRCRNWGVADKNSEFGIKTNGISRTGQGAGACVEPVVIGLVRRMVRGMGGRVQSGKAGFGRLSNIRLAGDLYCLGGPLREQARSHRGSRVNTILMTSRDQLWERACSRKRRHCHYTFPPQTTKSPPSGGLLVLQRYQNNFSFGASSFNGSFFAVCSFQPPPSALYRLTALTSCARRSVISTCSALNS